MRDALKGNEDHDGAANLADETNLGEAASDLSSSGDPLELPGPSFAARMVEMQDRAECSCELHEGVQVINEKFELSVDLAFDAIFTDSSFTRQFFEQRKISNATISPWTDTSLEKGSTAKSRHLVYTVSLNHALAKTVLTKETQELLRGIPGEVYVVRADAENSGAPYSDCFTVKTRWCLTRGERRDVCHLHVHGVVVFKKLSWGVSLMKAFIEKSAIEGFADYCKDLIIALRQYSQTISMEAKELCGFADYCEATSTSHNFAAEDLPLTRDEGVAGPLPSFSAKSIPICPSLAGATTRETFLLKAILSVLVLLLALNVLLYYRLWQLETAVISQDSLLTSTSGGAHIPDQALIAKWRRVIANAIKLMKDMEKSLVNLKYKFDDEL